MRELNVDFMDLYKSVDRFLRDAYSSSEGVSEYIRCMETYDIRGRQCVPSWRSDYDMLKHLRWIRNQLSHEVGYDSDICTEDDYEWLRSFDRRLYSAEDPVAILYRLDEPNRQRQSDIRRLVYVRQDPVPEYRAAYQKPKRRGFFQWLSDLFN